MSYVIVGNGPAGVNAMERIRQINPKEKIILVASEANPPYSRIMTPEYMVNEILEEDIYIRSKSFYKDYGIETRLGHKVEQVIPKANQVVLDDGETISYKKLLIATGSRPCFPNGFNMEINGVFSLWNKEDAENIKQYLPSTRQAVIIGTGLVGLQAARALTSYGIKVKMVELADRLMPAQLDSTASKLLKKAMETRGIEVFLSTCAKNLITENNQVKGIKTDNAVLEADLVLVTIGVKPNLELILGTEVAIRHGIVVNKRLETNVSNIYAAGDVAETNCLLTNNQMVRALWLNAVQQGKAAGANMAGLTENYPGSYNMNSIQLFGVPIITCGLTFACPGIEEIYLKLPSLGSYQKLLVKENRLVGFLLMGEIQLAGILYHKLGRPFDSGFWRKLQIMEADEIAV
ncbi:NAD(P)/FAD-dependent oxidoreductase [Desulfitibacter alkalitolerans]|uniref:NAD(P)/FAD-dependent oxidoreductase n=1 Tax=Desulfitibacter alkalitolerans TaxID=264641 RepID=UPI000686F919|nr:FAD-dependent oxidoreductase [Desulfitibacter alkalitolerans]